MAFEAKGRGFESLWAHKMIPFFELPRLELPFGQKIDIFGVLSAAGVMTGATLAARAARKYWPGDDEPARGLVTWAVMFGLYGGHFMHIFAYHPELLVNDWSLPLRFWDGLSSMGGVLGSLIGIGIYFRRIKTPFSRYIDALALGATPGWAVARIGCFLVHDHPGVRTDFPLAVDFPVRMYGGPRHDLGLYDMFVLTAITALLYFLARYRPRQGRLMGELSPQPLWPPGLWRILSLLAHCRKPPSAGDRADSPPPRVSTSRTCFDTAASTAGSLWLRRIPRRPAGRDRACQRWR